MENFDNFSYIARHNVVDITNICNIKAGVELFADYGEDYDVLLEKVSDTITVHLI